MSDSIRRSRITPVHLTAVNLLRYVAQWWELYAVPIPFTHLRNRYGTIASGHDMSMLDLFLHPLVKPHLKCLFFGNTRLFAPLAAWNAMGEEERMIMELKYSAKPKQTAKRLRRKYGAGLLHSSEPTTIGVPPRLSMGDIAAVMERENESKDK